MGRGVTCSLLRGRPLSGRLGSGRPHSSTAQRGRWKPGSLPTLGEVVLLVVRERFAAPASHPYA